MLYSAGRSITQGVFVEFGTWIGQSSRCIGAGLNLTARLERLYSFDAFEFDPTQRYLIEFSDLSQELDHFEQAGLYDYWKTLMHDVYPSAFGIKGWISSEFARAPNWAYKTVDVFCIRRF